MNRNGEFNIFQAHKILDLMNSTMEAVVHNCTDCNQEEHSDEVEHRNNLCSSAGRMAAAVAVAVEVGVELENSDLFCSTSRKY